MRVVVVHDLELSSNARNTTGPTLGESGAESFNELGVGVGHRGEVAGLAFVALGCAVV